MMGDELSKFLEDVAQIAFDNEYGFIVWCVLTVGFLLWAVIAIRSDYEVTPGELVLPFSMSVVTYGAAILLDDLELSEARLDEGLTSLYWLALSTSLVVTVLLLLTSSDVIETRLSEGPWLLLVLLICTLVVAFLTSTQPTFGAWLIVLLVFTVLVAYWLRRLPDWWIQPIKKRSSEEARRQLTVALKAISSIISMLLLVVIAVLWVQFPVVFIPRVERPPAFQDFKVPVAAEAPTVAQLARQHYYLKDADPPYQIADSASRAADYIIGFNSFPHRDALMGYNPGNEIEAGTVVYLPPADSDWLYWVERGESLNQIASCATDKLKAAEDCEVIPVEELIAANRDRLELAEGETFVISANNVIVRPPHPATQVEVAGLRLRAATVAFAYGILTCALIITIVYLVGSDRRGNVITHLFVSATGNRLSVSKFQMWLWSIVFLFTYTSVIVARLIADSPDPLALEEVPETLIILMGFSVATYSAAKAIVLNQKQKEQEEQSQVHSEQQTTPSLGSLIEDEAGRTDITRFQLLAFTLLGVVIYGFRLVTELRSQTLAGLQELGVPDVDTVIVALILAGQATYLVKRGTSDAPEVTGVIAVLRDQMPPALLINGRRLGGPNASEMRLIFSEDPEVTHTSTAPVNTSSKRALLWESFTPALPRRLETGDEASVAFRVGNLDVPPRKFLLRVATPVTIKEVRGSLAGDPIERWDPQTASPRATLWICGHLISNMQMSVRLKQTRPDGQMIETDVAQLVDWGTCPTTNLPCCKVILDLRGIPVGAYMLAVSQVDLLRDEVPFYVGTPPTPRIDEAELDLSARQLRLVGQHLERMNTLRIFYYRDHQRMAFAQSEIAVSPVDGKQVRVNLDPLPSQMSAPPDGEIGAYRVEVLLERKGVAPIEQTECYEVCQINNPEIMRIRDAAYEVTASTICDLVFDLAFGSHPSTLAGVKVRLRSGWEPLDYAAFDWTDDMLQLQDVNVGSLPAEGTYDLQFRSTDGREWEFASAFKLMWEPPEIEAATVQNGTLVITVQGFVRDNPMILAQQPGRPDLVRRGKRERLEDGTFVVRLPADLGAGRVIGPGWTVCLGNSRQNFGNGVTVQ